MFKCIKDLLNMMQGQKKALYLSLFLSFVDGIFIMVPLVMGYLIIAQIPEFTDNVLSTLDWDKMFQYTIIMCACILIRMTIRYITMRLRSGAGYKEMAEERKFLGNELKSVSMGYFTKKNLGDLVATITSDVSFIELEGLGVIEKAAAGVPAVIVGMVFLFYFDYRIALITAILFIPTFSAYKRLAGVMDRLDLRRQELIGEATESTVEFVKGLPVLKVYNQGEKEFEKTKRIFSKLKALSIKVELAHLPSAGIFQMCFRVITTAIVLAAGIQGHMDFAHVFLLVLASFSLFSAVELMGIYRIFSNLTQDSVDRINQIKDMPKMNDTYEEGMTDNFDIEFDNVSFAYECKKVLDGISFKVPEKSVTALVGLSGSGKTTITNLVARFWDVKDGEVKIGGET